MGEVVASQGQPSPVPKMVIDTAFSQTMQFEMAVINQLGGGLGVNLCALMHFDNGLLESQLMAGSTNSS